MSVRREQILAEMGIKPRWRLRDAGTAAVDADAVEATSTVSSDLPAEAAAVTLASSAPLDATPAPLVSPTATAPGSVVRVEGLDWEGLERAVSECRACRLCERRKQAVLGIGDRHAEWMFVGEGPGAEEDERGEPFVGQAGRLLDAMLDSVGMQRSENVYIANAVKCRPPGNRTPEAEEMATCRPYLVRQIELVQPKLLVAMGRPAAQTLLQADDIRISASRKRVFHYGEIPVVVTYHPAYLLRNLPDKAKAWEDLCFALDEMAKLEPRS